MLICDTSGLLAYLDASDPHNADVSAVIEADPGPFVVSPYVVAELDYLVATRLGTNAELSMLAELTGGAWELAEMTDTDLRAASGVIEQYRDQEIGVADASLVVLAQRFRTNRLLTLDWRHFSVVRASRGTPFTLLPDRG